LLLEVRQVLALALEFAFEFFDFRLRGHERLPRIGDLHERGLFGLLFHRHLLLNPGKLFLRLAATVLELVLAGLVGLQGLLRTGHGCPYLREIDR